LRVNVLSKLTNIRVVIVYRADAFAIGFRLIKKVDFMHLRIQL